MTTIARLAPDARQRVLSALGAVLPSAKLYTYITQTTTPTPTYSDSDLDPAHENTNPVIADSGGLFGPLFLAFGVAYTFTLKDQNDNVIWTQDDITAGGVEAATYDVTDYGAVGNGSTDDTVAVQTAITAAADAGGGEVYFPAGTYKLTAALNCTTTAGVGASKVSFRGQGRARSILAWTDNATKGLVIAGAATTVASPMLSSNAAIGDKTVSVASASGLSIGGNAYLQDSGSHTGSFFTKIANISGTTITLQGAMPVALTTAASAQLFSYSSLITGVTISDLAFTCTAGSGVANKLTLLELRRCFEPQVFNCDFDGSVGPLITVATCLDGVVARCHFQNALTVAGAGIEIQTSTGFEVYGCWLENVAFGLTPARSPYTKLENNRIVGRESIDDFGRGIRFSDGSNFGRSVGNNVSDNVLFGIYFQDSSYCTSTGDSVSFNGNSGAPGEHGIVCGGFLSAGSQHNTINGATVRGASGYGILVTSSDGVAVEEGYHSIVNCNVSGCYEGAVASLANSHMTLTGGFYSGPTTTVGGILRVTASAAHCTIVGPTVVAESGSPDAVNTAGGDGTNRILAVNTIALIEPHANDLVVIAPANFTKTSSVATGANTTETTAWSQTIKGGTLVSPGQSFEMHGFFSFAANGNNKSITVYVGTSTVVSTDAGNNVGVWITVHGQVKANGNIVWDIMVIEGTAVLKNTFQLSTDNWANDQLLKFTMTNGSASAGDITFQCGDISLR